MKVRLNSEPASKFSNALIFTVFATYPLLVFFLLKHYGLNFVVFLLLSVAVFKLLLQRNKSSLLLFLITVILCVLSSLFNADTYVKLLPVLINIGLFSVFCSSLFKTPMVQIFAEKFEGRKLTSKELNYTRSVTKIWTVFFLVNAAIAFYTSLFSSLEAWSFYNGFLSYILVGVLFAGEYAVRLFMKSRWQSEV